MTPVSSARPIPGRDFPADHLVRLLRYLLHGVQHVGYGTFADVDPEDGLEQVRKPLERDILVGTEVRGERHDVGPEGYRSIHFIGEPSFAAVAAGALQLHLEMARHHRHDRKRDVITCLAAAIVAASMPSGLPHSKKTVAGYQHSVPVTFPDGSSVLP